MTARTCGLVLLCLLLGETPCRAENPVATQYLLKAIAYRSLKDVQTLVKRGADVNVRAEGGRTPLMLLASEGAEAPALINLFIANGADVNATAEGGLTALMCAAYYKKEYTLNALLGAGAEVNAQDVGGMTALMHAVRCPFPEETELTVEEQADKVISIIDTLLEEGADPALVDLSGNTALIHAVRGRQPPAVVSYLRKLLERSKRGAVGRSR